METPGPIWGLWQWRWKQTKKKKVISPLKVTVPGPPCTLPGGAALLVKLQAYQTRHPLSVLASGHWRLVTCRLCAVQLALLCVIDGTRLLFFFFWLLFSQKFTLNLSSVFHFRHRSQSWFLPQVPSRCLFGLLSLQGDISCCVCVCHLKQSEWIKRKLKKLHIPIHRPILPRCWRRVCQEVEDVQKYAAIGGVRTCMFVYWESMVKKNLSLIMLAHVLVSALYPKWNLI